MLPGLYRIIQRPNSKEIPLVGEFFLWGERYLVWTSHHDYGDVAFIQPVPCL